MAFVSDRRTKLPHLTTIGLVFGLIVAPAIARAEPRLACPPEMALVSQSCVDRWEATLVEVHKNGSESPWTPYYTPMGRVVRAISKPGVVPQGYVSMAIAWGACRKSGKRLCHAKEWIAACRGAQKGAWPYGAVRLPGVCIDHGRTYALPKLHSGAERYENRTMNDPRLNQLENTVALTGSAPGCTNELGVFDMVGNLNEWIDDQTMRGGFYLDVEQLGEGCGYATKAHSKVYDDYSTGFRCCKDAEVEPERDSCATVGERDERGVLDLAFDVSTTIEPLAAFIASFANGSARGVCTPSG